MFKVYLKKNNMLDLNEQNRKLVIVEVREVSADHVLTWKQR